MQDFKIISGGQVGIDRYALDWAIRNNVPHGGWCPKGRRAEDGVIPGCYNLQETSSKNYAVRTRRNVIDSDAVLIITPTQELTGGSLLTKKYATNNYVSCLHICPGDDWRHLIDSFVKSYWTVLNVAGPRQAVGMEQFVCDVLDEVITKIKPDALDKIRICPSMIRKKERGNDDRK